MSLRRNTMGGSTQNTLCGNAAWARRVHPPAQELHLLSACAGVILGRTACGCISTQGAGMHAACIRLALRAETWYCKQSCKRARRLMGMLPAFSVSFIFHAALST